MSSTNTTDQAADAEDLKRWKQKYDECLDALERKEAAWSRLESDLYRNMGQLALVLYGTDAELDSSLDGLRSILRSQGDQAEVERAISSLHALRGQAEHTPPPMRATPPPL